jgi:HTH-type transcriptional regulator / antitoxin HipB
MEQALIGKMVQFHRKQSGLSQTGLAKLAGLGKTVVFDIEKGKSTIRLDTLLKVLNVLNIRLDFSSPLMAKLHEALDEKS